MNKKKTEDVLIIEDIIKRTRLIQTFLSKSDVRKVKNSYKTHDYKLTDKIKDFDGIINDAPSAEGYVWIDNPNGKNIILCVRDMKTLINNHKFVFKNGLCKN